MVQVISVDNLVFGLCHVKFEDSRMAYARSLPFDKPHALPEEINMLGNVGKVLYLLFEGGDPPFGNAENVKELVVEGFWLVLLAIRIGPFGCKLSSAVLNFVPRKVP